MRPVSIAYTYSLLKWVTICLNVAVQYFCSLYHCRKCWLFIRLLLCGGDVHVHSGFNMAYTSYVQNILCMIGACPVVWVAWFWYCPVNWAISKPETPSGRTQGLHLPGEPQLAQTGYLSDKPPCGTTEISINLVTRWRSMAREASRTPPLTTTVQLHIMSETKSSMTHSFSWHESLQVCCLLWGVPLWGAISPNST